MEDTKQKFNSYTNKDGYLCIQFESKAEAKPLVWRTYDEWQDQDMQVQRGERSTRIDGIPKFNQNQVKPVDDYYPEAASAWDWYKD